MKQTGIWLDYDVANVIHLTDEGVITNNIDSNIEHFNPKGGSKSSLAWGPVDTISESKLMARKKQQSNKYFKEILDQIKDSTEVVIMGPAEAKLQFNNFLKSIKGLKLNVKELVTVDSMTHNQKVAKVKELFLIKR